MFSIWINQHHRIPRTIRIGADAVVLLTQRIHPVPAGGDGIVLACAVVVGVQAVHAVVLLAAVPAGLIVAVRGAVAELRPEGVVVHPLDDPPALRAVVLRHLPDVAQVVAVVVEEGEAVLRGVAPGRLAVALPKLVLVDAPVLKRQTAAEQIVGGVRILNLRGCQLPAAACGHADVRHRREVHRAELLARGAVDVAGHAAVGELYADGVVQAVKVYPWQSFFTEYA